MTTEHKPYNLALRIEDLQRVGRILVCRDTMCRRTIVEYGDGIPETRHSQGLPAAAYNAAVHAAKPIIRVACNHHGGEAYQPPKPENPIYQHKPYIESAIY